MEQSASTESASTPRAFFMEHRWGQRMPCRATIRLSAGSSISGAGRIRDVSSSGAFIETTLELPLHAHLDLVVLGNESAKGEVEISATVVRTDRDGVGIEWCETPSGSVCAVVGCVTRCGAGMKG